MSTSSRFVAAAVAALAVSAGSAGFLAARRGHTGGSVESPTVSTDPSSDVPQPNDVPQSSAAGTGLEEQGLSPTEPAAGTAAVKRRLSPTEPAGGTAPVEPGLSPTEPARSTAPKAR